MHRPHAQISRQVHFFFPLLCGLLSLATAYYAHCEIPEQKDCSYRTTSLRRNFMLLIITALVLFHYMCNLTLSFDLYLSCQYKSAQIFGPDGKTPRPFHITPPNSSFRNGVDKKSYSPAFIACFACLIAIHAIVTMLQAMVQFLHASVVDACLAMQIEFKQADNEKSKRRAGGPGRRL